jgi:hypothetical protein
MRRTIAFLALLLPGCTWPFPEVQDPPPPMLEQPDTLDTQHDGGSDLFQADGPMADLNPASFPDMPGEMAIGNATGVPLTVRVRGLKTTVALDCALVAKAPQVMLARALFAPATTWLVNSGRAIGVSGGGRPCTALLVDGSGLDMRLLFWTHTSHPQTMVQSTVAGGNPDRLLTLQAAEGGVAFAPRVEVLAPPPLLEPGPAPGCGQPNPSGDLAWSTPVPLGDQTILQLQSAPDGCMQMSLLGKLGVAGWTLCLPPGAFKFQEGDSFFTAALTGGHNLSPIDGFELIADKHKLRFGRGDDLVYFGDGTLQLDSIPACGGAHDVCGDLLAPLLARITRPGQPDLALVPGQSVDLGNGAHLHVVQASSLPIADTQCMPDGKIGARHVQSVFSQDVELQP